MTIFCPSCSLTDMKPHIFTQQAGSEEWRIVTHEGGMLVLGTGRCNRCGILIRIEQHSLKLDDGSWQILKVSQ